MVNFVSILAFIMLALAVFIVAALWCHALSICYNQSEAPQKNRLHSP